MCGVSANKQDKELQVDVLDLSDKNREALVSIFDVSNGNSVSCSAAED